MLLLEDVHAYYGQSHVLQSLSFNITAGEVVSLLGRNGAGKTTAIITIMGYLKPRGGRIVYQGSDITGVPPYRLARCGFGFVPQERGIFPSLTVEENLAVAANRRRAGRWDLQAVYGLFPRLKERKSNLGFQLSGGEQQMLAIARALMTNPSLLLLDEPSEGLAPIIVSEILSTIGLLKREGLPILLVEQRLPVALAVADRYLVLNKGQIVLAGPVTDPAKDHELLRKYLSV